jgi:hypothetical protein
MKGCDRVLQIEVTTRLGMAAEGQPVGILRLQRGTRWALMFHGRSLKDGKPYPSPLRSHTLPKQRA